MAGFDPNDQRDRLLAGLAAERDRLAAAGAARESATVAAMLAIGERLPRLFQLPHPTAPGLCLVGAVVDPAAFLPPGAARPASATGKGTDRVSALLGCLGEAAEYLSQLSWGDEPVVIAAAPPAPAEVTATLLDLAGHRPGTQDIPWVRAERLHDGAISWLPAALCYRGLDAGADPRVKLGSGCAVGATPATARLQALLELVERDAVALWWLGGRQPRRISADLHRQADVPGLVAVLRQGRTGRRHWLLDVTTDLAVPVVVSVSCDPDGSGLACGFAARLDAAAAVRAAVLEMGQMEIAIHLVHLKRAQQGEAALDAADHAHLRRCHGFDARTCPLLLEEHAAAPLEPARPAGDARSLARRLAAGGVQVHGLDLTRPALGVPAYRALSCDLQPMPGSVVLPRLAREIARSGGGPGLEGGIEIL